MSRIKRPIYGTSSEPPLESELPIKTRIDYKLFEENFERGEMLGGGANGKVFVWVIDELYNIISLIYT